MKLTRIGENKQLAQLFMEMPLLIYTKDKYPNWIRPLDKDIAFVFDKEKNRLFKGGEAERWLLLDDNGQMIGRIAAFFNIELGGKENQLTGGIGFFECIDAQEAANLLFNAAETWLKERNIQAVDGPINFGERDKWWGLLVNGFDREPNYTCNYHPPYYQALFENAGYQVYFKQFTFYREVNAPMSERIKERAEKIFGLDGYEFSHFSSSNPERFKFAFQTVYNAAWVKHGTKEMSIDQVNRLMAKMKPIMQDDLFWFAFYKGEPIGFFLMLPELNQLFKHLNGSFNLWAKLKFLWLKWWGSKARVTGIIFGVVPRFQGKGVESAMIMAAANYIKVHNSPYKYLEMNWIGDFNPKMIKVAENLDAVVVKVHHTYRKMLDVSLSFERHPEL